MPARSTYALVAADYGKTISVRVTAPQDGYLSAIRTSTASAFVAKGIIQIGANTAADRDDLRGALLSPMLTATWALDELGTARPTSGTATASRSSGRRTRPTS